MCVSIHTDLPPAIGVCQKVGHVTRIFCRRINISASEPCDMVWCSVGGFLLDFTRKNENSCDFYYSNKRSMTVLINIFLTLANN